MKQSADRRTLPCPTLRKHSLLVNHPSLRRLRGRWRRPVPQKQPRRHQPSAKVIQPRRISPYLYPSAPGSTEGASPHRQMLCKHKAARDVDPAAPHTLVSWLASKGRQKTSRAQTTKQPAVADDTSEHKQGRKYWQQQSGAPGQLRSSGPEAGSV